MHRTFSLTIVLVALFASEILAQVKVDVRLDRDRYLAGQPIFVVVDVLNVGDDPVGYGTGMGCGTKFSLTVIGARPRVPPRLAGCFSGESGGGACGSVSHPPLLAPGQRTSFRYLVTGYDLTPGRYVLTASGKADVLWKHYPSLGPVPAPPPRHKDGDPVPGADFNRTLPLTIVAATEKELLRALAPLIADADSVDPVRRSDARAALVETAHPSLESLIARFAAENRDNVPAIDALARIATPTSRSALRQLFEAEGDLRVRDPIVRALARVGHAGDAEFLTDVLQDATQGEYSRRYAALGLGRIGGDQAVRYLERALPTATGLVRSAIATALGNTRSRMAVPVLIRMFGGDARNDVCGALQTLTHRPWCGGTPDDAATRRRWMREWNETGWQAPIYGVDSCDEAERARVADVRSVPAAPAEASTEPRVPPRVVTRGRASFALD